MTRVVLVLLVGLALGAGLMVLAVRTSAAPAQSGLRSVYCSTPLGPVQQFTGPAMGRPCPPGSHEVKP